MAPSDPPGAGAVEPDWDRVDRLLSEALARPSAARAAFLDHACAGDAPLRALLAALVDAAEAEDGFLEAPAASAAARLVADWAGTRGEGGPPLEAPPAGARVGAYRLLDKLGEGGMGTVWRAERADGQFEHTAALKLVRHGLASDDLRRRFRQERQILARLAHPHIARLLDGGVVEGPGGEEQPYLVMEYVAGVPITDYADDHRLPIEGRLALFAQVAEAVAYAHGNLVVHRDLKPSNILVTEDGDGDPSVKLLDFGIARLLDEDDGAAETPQTVAPRMTPEYAAPEQVCGQPVTTATDVYALGILLYELLTGRRPYAFARRTPAEIERVVCEQAPERPSAAVARTPTRSDAGPAGPVLPEAVSWARATEPAKLRRRLRGDLDNVVLKALAKEPAARYPTANALLEDVRRHLGGLPVEAHPPTAAYRAGKFVRRHRWGVAAAAAFAVFAVAFSALYAAGITRERDRAQGEADKAARVTGFLLSLFEANDPDVARGDTLTAGELMARGLREAEALRHQPEVQAQMLEVIGRAYASMGRHDLAVDPLERALQLRRRLHPTPHPDLARSLYLAGVIASDRSHLDRAEPLLRAALAMQREVLAPGDPEIGATLYGLGGLLHYQGRRAEADSLFREALGLFRTTPSTAGPEVASTLLYAAQYLHFSRSYADAEVLYRRAIDVFETYYSGEHPRMVTPLVSLADVLLVTHRYEEAERVARRGLHLAETQMGSQHEEAQWARRELATVHLHRGRYREAELLLRQLLVAPPLDANLEAAIRLNLGQALMEQGRFEEAEGAVVACLVHRESTLGEQSPYVGEALVWLGRLEYLRADYGAAAAHFSRARAGLRAGHPFQGLALLGLGEVRMEAGAYAEAERLLREGLAIMERDPPQHPYWRSEAHRAEGTTLTHLGRYDEAERHLREGLRLAVQVGRPDLAAPAREALRGLSAARAAR